MARERQGMPKWLITVERQGWASGEPGKVRAEGRNARARKRAEEGSRTLKGSERQTSQAQQLANNRSDPPRAPEWLTGATPPRAAERLSAVDHRVLWAVRQRG